VYIYVCIYAYIYVYIYTYIYIYTYTYKHTHTHSFYTHLFFITSRFPRFLQIIDEVLVEGTLRKMI